MISVYLTVSVFSNIDLSDRSGNITGGGGFFRFLQAKFGLPFWGLAEFGCPPSKNCQNMGTPFSNKWCKIWVTPPPPKNNPPSPVMLSELSLISPYEPCELSTCYCRICVGMIRISTIACWHFICFMSENCHSKHRFWTKFELLEIF